MTSNAYEPAKLVRAPGAWTSTRASFDLAELTPAESSGVLLQWALARHLRAEVRRAGYTGSRDFATSNGLSAERVKNFLGGHRRANFEDLAAVLEILGPRAWPDPVKLSGYIEEARRRSEDGDSPDAALLSLYTD